MSSEREMKTRRTCASRFRKRVANTLAVIH